MAKRKRTAKKSTKKAPANRKPTADAQVATMERLNQTAAAWLAGLESRTLRDTASIPRDAAGKYHALDILKFVVARVPVAELPDEQLEQANILAEILAYESQALQGVIAFLETVESRFGNPGLAAVGKQILSHLRDLAASDPNHFQIPTAEESEATLRDELAALMKTRREAAILRHGRAHLRFATVCDNCGQQRQGTRWIDSPPPPPGCEVFGGMCPKCQQGTSPARPTTNETEPPDKMLLDDIMDKKPGKP